MSRKNVLLLCDDAARHTGTVDNHIQALKEFSASNVVIMDSRAAGSMDIDLELFDAIVFHYSIVISMSQFLQPAFFARLANYSRPKILFIQDEYRWVDRTAAATRELGICVIFTVVNKDVVRTIYRDSFFDNVRFELTLTGYVPQELLSVNVPSYGDRSIDVSYRARRVPSWLGAFGQEKWTIGERFLRDSQQFRLNCDIAMSEDTRLYGKSWIDFVASSKAVLGTESGASFIDFSGEVRNTVEAYEKANPGISFDEVQRRFLEGDGNTVIHVISPRCFEAAALKTLMILYPGNYSGILVAGRHYIELLRDHSNMAEVVAIIQDHASASKFIEAAYEEVACSSALTFKAFVARFDYVIGEVLETSSRNGVLTKHQNFNASEQLDRYEMLAARISRRRVAVMANVIKMQRASRSIANFVQRLFPEPLAKRMLAFYGKSLAAAKPLLKRIAFGREE
jgi:hypothetical protein